VRDWGVGWVTQIGRAQRTGMDIWIFGVYICITGFRDVDVMFIACRECLSPNFIFTSISWVLMLTLIFIFASDYNTYHRKSMYCSSFSRPFRYVTRLIMRSTVSDNRYNTGNYNLQRNSLRERIAKQCSTYVSSNRVFKAI
jgi:hypothetical protein